LLKKVIILVASAQVPVTSFYGSGFSVFLENESTQALGENTLQPAASYTAPGHSVKPLCSRWFML